MQELSRTERMKTNPTERDEWRALRQFGIRWHSDGSPSADGDGHLHVVDGFRYVVLYGLTSFRTQDVYYLSRSAAEAVRPVCGLFF